MKTTLPQRPLAKALPWLMRLMWILFGLGAIGFLYGSAVYVFNPDYFKHSFPVTVQYYVSGYLLHGEPQPPTVDWENDPPAFGNLYGDKGRLILYDPPRSIVYLSTLRHTLLLLLMGLILLMVHRLAWSYVRDHPFDPANAKRLDLIGWFILLRVVIDFGAHVWTQFRVADFVGLNGNGFDIEASFSYLTLWPFLYALVFFMLGEIFRRGTRLQRESDLTV